MKPGPAHICGVVNIGAAYTDEQREFMLALDRYKRSKGRPFPTCCEVLEVLKMLGYRKSQAVVEAFQAQDRAKDDKPE